jgi:hypothetical protein
MTRRPVAAVPAHAVRTLQRVMSVIWTVAGIALTCVVLGSPLTAFDPPVRVLVGSLCIVSVAVMPLRALAPELRIFASWPLQLIGGCSVAASVMSLFNAADTTWSVARVGWALLLLSLAAVAYLHQVGERVFLR